MLWFIIPALNERDSMPSLADSLSAACHAMEAPFRVVVVDDGSIDGTERAALAAFGEDRCSVIRFETNRGPGAAVDAGLRRAIARSAAGDFVVTLEADGTSDLGILAELLETIRAGSDVALASPFARGGDILGTSAFRHLLSWMANFLCDHWLGVRGVSTYSSFYRVHSREILERVYRQYGRRTIRETGFTYAVEMLAKLIRVGARVGEVAMVLDGRARRGESRMPILKTVVRYFVLFARLGPAWRASPVRSPAPEDPASMEAPGDSREAPMR